MKNLIEKYEALGFQISMQNEPMITACCMRIKSKSRFPKPLFNYRFRSIERMVEFCNEWVSRVAINVNSENERKAKKKEAQSNMKHNFEVGNIIYNSWGYDQTNIDFYQVVESKQKSIKIQPIHSYRVENSEGFMCCNVKPAVNEFKGEAILKKVVVSVGYNENVSYYIKAKHGSFCNYTNSENGIYSSWYA